MNLKKESGINRFFRSFVMSVMMLFQSLLFAQINSEANLKTAFEKHHTDFQEVVYAHLNKSKYAVNEMLAFTAYVVNKHERTLSLVTKNLYVEITNDKQETIKKQLIEVTNGIAPGGIKIDSSFQKGYYTLKAYTNWMRNFHEPNHFSTSFEVLDSSGSKLFTKVERSKNIDIQFLPESGHFLEGVINTVGVIAKDSLGFGVSGIQGKIVNKKGTQVADFRLNSLGIGRLSMIPKREENYILVLNDNGTESRRPFSPNIHDRGLLLKVNYNRSDCIVSVVTNDSSLESLKNKSFRLSFHNGKKINLIEFGFKNQPFFTTKIKRKHLSTGITIFTVFDQNNHPLAERLFFNDYNLKIHNSNTVGSRKKDSLLQYDFKYKSILNDSLHNVSISILPATTVAYKIHTNIISHTLIQPYIKGTIENGRYYFTNRNKQTQFDLDNLLITQGWSSYDWKDIFKAPKEKKYQFEKGILLQAKILEDQKTHKLILHNTTTDLPRFIDIYGGKNTFFIDDYYPTDVEFAEFSRRNDKGKLSKVALDVQFFPNQFLSFSTKRLALRPRPNYFAKEQYFDTELFTKLNDVEELEGIVIDAELLRKKQLGIQNTSFGRIKKLDKLDRNLTLANYINQQPGYRAFDDVQRNQIIIQHRSGDTPALLLNDRLVSEEIMFYYWLDIVDYIVIDPLAMEATFRKVGDEIKNYRGAIKIYENPKKFLRKKWSTLSQYKIPVSFSGYKSFYKPKYISYQDDFFKEYGVIDWLPKNKIQPDGTLRISFVNEQPHPIKLFIEGITQQGEYILEEKTIPLNK